MCITHIVVVRLIKSEAKLSKKFLIRSMWRRIGRGLATWRDKIGYRLRIRIRIGRTRQMAAVA